MIGSKIITKTHACALEPYLKEDALTSDSTLLAERERYHIMERDSRLGIFLIFT